MAAEHFICPNCKTTIPKPIQLQVLGDVASGGGSFIAMGETDKLTCPRCRHPIPKMGIIEGKFDPKADAGSIWVAIVVFAVIAFIVYKCAS